MKMFRQICERLLNSFWALNLDLALFIMRGKGVLDVAVVYATLIVKGKKTFAQVPEKLKEQVKEILIALDCPEMAE